MGCLVGLCGGLQEVCAQALLAGVLEADENNFRVEVEYGTRAEAFVMDAVAGRERWRLRRNEFSRVAGGLEGTGGGLDDVNFFVSGGRGLAVFDQKGG